MKIFYFALVTSLFAYTSHSQNVNIPDTAFLNNLLFYTPAAGGSVIDTDADGLISIAEAQAYTGIILAGTQHGTINDFTGLEAFTEITGLQLQSNSNVQTIDLSSNSKVINLRINTENFTSIDISQLTALEDLFINNLQSLSSLDVSNNTLLKELQVDRVNITSLDVSALAALESFETKIGQLTSVTFGNHPVLTELTIRDHDLASIDLSTLPALQTLNLSQNLFATVDISTNALLENVNLSNNQLTTLDVNNQPNLLDLNIEGNNLQNLSLVQNTQLEYLSISDELNALDLSQNSTLAVVYVAGNPTNSNLTELDLSNNPALIEVDVYSTQNLSSINIANGNNAAILYAGFLGNPNLSCIQIDAGFTPPSDIWFKDDTASYTDNCNLSIDSQLANEIIIYPNPVSDVLKVNSNTIKTIEVINLKGQLLKQFKDTSSIDVSDLQKGTYFLHVTSDSGLTTVEKFIKK